MPDNTPLNLPTYEHQVHFEGSRYVILDILRKKYVALTPEEWVRQHFIHYLINSCQYPKGLMKAENPLKYNTLQKRADIVIYKNDGSPFMIVECKAPDVTITKATFDQALCYNNTLKASYIVITNGINHFCWRTDFTTNKSVFLKDLPPFSN